MQNPPKPPFSHLIIPIPLLNHTLLLQSPQQIHHIILTILTGPPAHLQLAGKLLDPRQVGCFDVGQWDGAGVGR